MDPLLGAFIIAVLARALKVISRQERRIAELQNELMAAKWLRENEQ